MSYLVLARKYRPQTFDDLVGQGHVAQTLANAITAGRVAHAFVFTGVRGVGKTTSARLLAKCLNCTSGPTPAPCQTCGPCTEIAAGTDLDVQEIDGASYNGVDEVRRLQEGLGFRPARDRHKIYIVDEVHMLSGAAWNAFLKTLEEPPPHVKFIFATTEVHKIPVTILSRCQRYDFKLIDERTIQSRLSEVLSQEKIEADAGSLSMLAREAQGSMRDAMSLVDQVVAYSGDKLTEKDVALVLGVASRGALSDLAKGLVSGDASGLLRLLATLSDQGLDLPHLARDLLLHLRNLVVVKVAPVGDPALSSLTDDEVKELSVAVHDVPLDDLLRLHGGFSRHLDDIVRSSLPRAAFEMALVRLARRPPLVPISDLLTRISELESRLVPSSVETGDLPRGRTGGVPSTKPGGVQGAAVPTPSRKPAAPDGDRPTGIRQKGPLSLVHSVTDLGEVRRPKDEPEPPQFEGALALKAAEPVLTEPGTLADPESWLGAFRKVLERLRAREPHIAALYEQATLIQFDKKRVVLGFAESARFAGEAASDAKAKELVSHALSEHFGSAPVVEVVLDAGDRGKTPTALSALLEEQKRTEEREKERLSQHPLVRSTMELFLAEIRSIKMPKGDE